jgi:hypothetical protein
MDKEACMTTTREKISLGETVLTSRIREKMSSDALFVDFVHNCLDQHQQKGNNKGCCGANGYASAFTYPGDRTKIRITTETEQTATVVKIAE